MEWQFGPYLIQGLIARGGMGEIHRAHDTRHQRTVALKLIAERYAGDAEFRRRFQREAQATARLRDPHVIPIHSYGEINGRLYLDMRLVDGADLATQLDASGPMPPDRAVGLIEQVAHALDSAHADGLVHRDVKPSNVLVSSSGFAYLVDFGIAYAANAGTALTSTGITVGTLAYMAPERFGEAPADPRSDVYSLACMLYQCLTGRKPFERDATVAMINAHLNDDPPRPGSTAPHLGAAFDPVITRGMAKHPAHRFTSAGELARAARAALDSTGPVPHPAAAARGTAPQRVPHRRKGLLIGAALGALLVAGAAAGGAVVSRGGADPAADAPAPTAPWSSTAPVPPDLGLSVPLSTPPCDGGFTVVVGAAFDADTAQRLLDEHAGAHYLHVPTTPCGASATTSKTGKDIYSIYYGPYQDRSSACAEWTSASATAGDAYVKQLSATSGGAAVISCG
ncbi:protein kinase [Saccharopolyspora sp. NFXS83]|uniref:protein kinase domain-containing protein n=1 Tax=Saccharopolyspora sp. NFXS83 TaxID=2993560 RepID=UPI00224A7A17|nr:protein kinase [Saccharopolyspora sp. NFXS83]MCX2729618.1 protein kinase [Saccharopolyspora sp. NFXS83]